MQAFCDFDGTISKEDVTDLVLERFARPQWREIESDWVEGKITSTECMKRQIALIRTTPHDLDAFLDEIEIDSGFVSFKRFCDANNLRLTVVSDGVDYFIRRILLNHGMSGIDVRANTLVREYRSGETRFSLLFPFARSHCQTGSGVCKCAVLAGVEDHVFVGDGRSDFCAAHEATVVFAKEALARHCEQNHIPFIRYNGFADVLPVVEAVIKRRAPQHLLAMPQSA